MHIIFGEAVAQIPNSFTVLELDTFRQVSKNQTVTAYCVVEKIAPQDFATLEAYKKIHDDLIKYYKQRQWDYCQQAITGLMGKWNGELDSFYTDLLDRVCEYKNKEPNADWDGTRIKKD